jgi:alkylation response protein AidB-like acyl-CoA dehydrogenase
MMAPWRWLADSSGPCSTGVRVGSGTRARRERHLRGIAAGGLVGAMCATCV